MPEAFQALRCVYSVHCQVVDTKDPCTGEPSGNADLGYVDKG